jgi:hypothetical protein
MRNMRSPFIDHHDPSCTVEWSSPLPIMLDKVPGELGDAHNITGKVEVIP